MNFIVTHIENIQQDEDGNYIKDEDGIPQLIDPDAVGVLTKTHVIPLTQVVDGMVKTGVSSACEVFWDKKRSPAPAMVPPDELVWLSMQDNDEEFEDESEESDEEEVIEDAEPLDADSDDEGYF